MKFESRADLLIAAGESIKMQEKFGINPMMKVNGTLHPIDYCIFSNTYSDDEFPLAVVEGKPVFVGDELYVKSNGMKCEVLSSWQEMDVSLWSWNPPKPKTVFVELPYEFVDQYARCIGGTTLIDACKKALEETK